LWQAASGEPVGQPLLHQHSIRAIAFSPDGNTVLTGSRDKTARLWDVGTGKPIGPPFLHEGFVESAAFSPDGKTILTGSLDGKARLWRMPTPPTGDPERILLWTQVISGLRLEADGTFDDLDAQKWERCRQRLEELGGRP